MLTDRQRLRHRAATPRLVALHRALGRLKASVTVMNTGAHPDDEQNGMLAVMRHQMGMRIVIACSTRGEGGQNALGPERGGTLGVLRSREMEEAARIIDADIAWLGHGPDDPVHDFGFSKSGPDTLARWGHERVLERLVRAYRHFRPDIVIPTFLDVPGQHGHHRAMTQAAEEAIALAADPAAFPGHAGEGLQPWHVAKYYLPAWSGGGDTYDDEVPPPPATTEVVADGADPVSGMSYDRFGEVSRAFHASQNMGFWRNPAQFSWALHLGGGKAEGDIRDGLPGLLADLGNSPALVDADVAIADAIAAFTDQARLVEALISAKSALRQAQVEASEAERQRHGHRLSRKLAELDAALALAAGLDVSFAAANTIVAPGGTAKLVAEVEPGLAENVTLTPIVGIGFAAPAAIKGTGRIALALDVLANASIANAFAPDWQSLGGNGAISLRLDAVVGNTPISIMVDPEEAVQIAPRHPVSLDPQALIIPLRSRPLQQVDAQTATGVHVTLHPAPGLTTTPNHDGFLLTPSDDLLAGRHAVGVRVDGQPAYAVTPITYPHIGHTHFVRPLVLDVLALDLELSAARIGYVGGGSDSVGIWLGRMGADVVALDTLALAGDLAGFDTIVVGTFAFGARPDLAEATPRLHRWVEAGGNLLTLYHRPIDGWQPARTPPRPITIGTPSLRWRVTNPAAPVTLLEPDHPLLVVPNHITSGDFDGWDKERGLYFASLWDEVYVPLLAMSDAGEKPLTGSLLSARIGKGRHTHTSLVLHHQLDKLVPGAFRLLANLVQPA